jgi:lysophospholipase
MSVAPGPIDPTRTFTIPRPDATLHAEWYAPAEGTPRGLVVVTHGYAEHCGRYREVAHALLGARVAVLTYDCRGHGKSSGPRGHVGRFDAYLDDLDAAIGWARGECAQRGLTDPRLVLLGHSHGSLITLRALTDESRSTGAVAAVVASPFLGLRLKVSPVKRFAGRIAAKLRPTLALDNEIEIEHLTSDEGKLAERRADTFCHGVATAGWFVEATEAQEHVHAHADRIAVPTQWLVGGADPIADPARSRAVADRIRKAPVEYHDLVGLKHEVFNERSRADVFALLTRFVGAAISEISPSSRMSS